MFFLILGCSKIVKYDPVEPIITVDYDMEPISQPKKTQLSEAYDFLDKSLFQQIKAGFKAPFTNKGRAWNVNALGNVPNSSWFTNRLGAIEMTLEEVARGADTIDGVADGEWLIVRGKAEGITPGFSGFHIQDRTGNRFVVKFDPKDNPEMLSGAEVISTKFLHAMGYNVPENYIAFFKLDQLKIKEGAKFVDPYGIPTLITPETLTEKLKFVAQHPDGSYRVIASRYITGKLLESFSYNGTRKDDPNDIIPHEHRRDLRGLKVLMAFLNNGDARGPNSLDTYVKDENGNGYVKHHLIDFGASLGSWSKFPKTPHYGHEYLWDGSEILKNLATFGAYSADWRKATSPKFEFTDIGLFESEYFEPQKWKTNYPNLAFQQMETLDAYWATKILMSFSDEHIRAIAATAQYTDPAATEYTAKTLMERRDIIGRYYFSRVNPLDNFQLQPGQGEFQDLDFEDLAVKYAFASKNGSQYQCNLFQLNEQGKKSELTTELLDGERTVSLSKHLENNAIAFAKNAGTYLIVSLRTKRENDTDWSKKVEVHLYAEASSKKLRVIGIDREG